MFALDVFEEGKGPVQILTELALHLVPAMVLVVALVFAWRRSWVGALMFGVAALGYAFWAGRAHLDWIAFISGPLLVTAVLFFLSWTIALRKQTPAAT